MSHAALSVPDPAAGHHWPTPLPETPGHSWESLGQSLVGSLLLSPGSLCAQGFVCALQESVSPGLCKFWWFTFFVLKKMKSAFESLLQGSGEFHLTDFKGLPPLFWCCACLWLSWKWDKSLILSLQWSHRYHNFFIVDLQYYIGFRCTILWFNIFIDNTLFKHPLDCKEIQPVHPKGDQSWVFIGRTDAEAEAPTLWPPDAKNWLIGKDPDAGRDWGQEEKGTTEDEMVGWHHWLDGHEFG